MAPKKRQAMLSRGPAGGVAADMAERATGRTLAGVSKLSSGRLKMVGVPRTKRVGMLLPPELSAAWKEQAAEEGITMTDLFEDVILRYLKSKGWRFEDR